MAILVVCRNCRSRFSVGDQFAGRKGPCPKCKEIIEIPKLEEQVKVHAPEHSEAGARGKTGELILKPVSREKTQVGQLTWIMIGVAALALLMVAFGLRSVEGGPPDWILALGAVGLGPPLAVAGYFFLRDDELAPYEGKELWLRAAIVGAVYALCWLGFSYVPSDWKVEWVYWLAFTPPFVVAGGTASFAALDLDFFSAVMHFAFYVLVTGLLAWVMGLPLLGAAPPERGVEVMQTAAFVVGLFGV